jgi:nucleoside phosphorylase
VKADGNCKSLDSTAKRAAVSRARKWESPSGFHFPRLLPRCIDSKFKISTVQSDTYSVSKTQLHIVCAIMMRAYTPYVASDSSDGKKTFDIGVVIALSEELTYFLNYVQKSELWNPVPHPEHFWADGHSFWKFDLTNEKGTVQVVVFLVAEMGTEYTAAATGTLLDKWHVPFIVNMGVTGSLDKDVKVGSIVIPSQITHYTANWKARDKNKQDNNTEFLIGTRAFATNRVVIGEIANFLATTAYLEWKTQRKDEVVYPKHPDFGPPQVYLGHVASGNVVIDSEHYKTVLKATDRKLMACEMEAAGFMIAEQFLQASTRAVSQFISLRCISDIAVGKEAAENETYSINVNGDEMESREWAMRNVTTLFLHLIDKQVLNADIDAQVTLLEDMSKQLKDRKKEAKSRGNQVEKSTEDILKGIKTATDFKELSNDKKIQVIKHFDPESTVTENTAATVLYTRGVELLRQHGHLPPAPKRKTEESGVTPHGPNKKPTGSATSSVVDRIDFPSSRSSNTTLESIEGEPLNGSVPVSELAVYVEKLSALIHDNRGAVVSQEWFDKLKATLDGAEADLHSALNSAE